MAISSKASGRKRGITPSVARAVQARDGMWCVYCKGMTLYPQIDHVFPWSRGGSDDIENLVVACLYCNTEKADFTVDEWQTSRAAKGQPWPVPNLTGVIAKAVAQLSEEGMVIDPELVSDMMCKFDRSIQKFRNGDVSESDLASKIVGATWDAHIERELEVHWAGRWAA